MLVIKNINIIHHEGCWPAATCAPWSVPKAFSVTPGTGCSHHSLGRDYATASREMWALGALAVPELWLQAALQQGNRTSRMDGLFPSNFANLQLLDNVLN